MNDLVLRGAGALVRYETGPTYQSIKRGFDSTQYGVFCAVAPCLNDSKEIVGPTSADRRVVLR